MPTFQKVKIRNIAEINPDSIGRNFRNEKIEYVDISSVGTGSMDEIQEMDMENAPSRAKRLVRPGDTIISTVRPNRRSFFYFKNPKDNTVVSTGFAVLRALKNNDSKYLYYIVTGQSFTDYLTKNAKGTAYPAVDSEIIYDGEVLIPEKIQDQVRIASVLSAYDDLIDNNEKRIKILEEIAQRFYAEWFVKFKFPGHDKIKMVESGTEYGIIPEGWEVKRLEKITSIITKGTTPTTLKKNFVDEGINFIKIESVAEGKFIIEEKLAKIDEETNELLRRSKLKEGDTLFSIAGAIGRTVLVTKRFLPANTNQALAIIRPLNEDYIYYIFQTISSERFYNFSIGRIVKTAQANVSLSVLSSANILIPGENILKLYRAKIEDLFITIDKLRENNSVLSKIRDFLIPQLVTGKRELK